MTDHLIRNNLRKKELVVIESKQKLQSFVLPHPHSKYSVKVSMRQRASLSNLLNKVFNLHEHISLCSGTLAYIFGNETLIYMSNIFYNKPALPQKICSWVRSLTCTRMYNFRIIFRFSCT